MEIGQGARDGTRIDFRRWVLFHRLAWGLGNGTLIAGKGPAAALRADGALSQEGLAAACAKARWRRMAATTGFPFPDLSVMVASLRFSHSASRPE